MAKSNIITVFGQTDGTNTTGVFTLTSKDFKNSVTHLQLDKGLKYKIWNIRISGEPVTVNIEKTEDVTASPPTWVQIDSYDLVSPGVIILEKRRPIVVHGKTGLEAIRFTWNQTTAAVSKISIDIEIEVMDE